MRATIITKGLLWIAGCKRVAAKRCFATEDYEGAMKTGVVCRRVRSVKDGKVTKLVEEYEINTALIEALNSVEKRAAIETGQEVDRADINLRENVADKAAILRKAFTLDELEEIEARILAAQTEQTVVVDAQREPDKTHTQGRSNVAAAESLKDIRPAPSSSLPKPHAEGKDPMTHARAYSWRNSASGVSRGRQSS